MKLKLRPTSLLLNFALVTCFVPSMFGMDEAIFEFDDLENINKSAPQLVTHKASSSRYNEDEEIFPFELTDKTPPKQLVVPPNAAIPYDTDNEEEESDDDTPCTEMSTSPHAPVAKSTVIRIKQRSQSDLVERKPKIKTRPRSGSDPIAIPGSGSEPELSYEAETVSIGLRLLYSQYDYKGQKPLREYPFFNKIYENSKYLTKKEKEMVLASLPKDSYSAFAFKSEFSDFFMGKPTAIERLK